MLKEFRDFINKGNVLDLAVAVILGAAFGKIVGSLVDDLLMPVIGSIFNINFSSWGIELKPAQTGPDGTVIAPAVVFGIGKFIQSLIDFILVAFPVYLIVKSASKVKLVSAPAAPIPTEELLREIRDLLKK